jgi:crotonobetainyl-CoA:carnitine CoA-transferase CaiB-like acyl-CoA transferase
MTDTTNGESRTGPLSGITVLDLTRVRAGPTCVRQFGDWGADVIKIEAPGAGDFTDRPDFDFQNLHRNKRSISLNLKTPEGVEVLKKLAARADVLVENYRPDVKHRLGIDYDALKPVNPRLIYTSISGFGQDGPYAGRPGVDQVAQGLGGLMSITGEPGRGPMRVGIPVADLSAGLFAALGTMAALIERETSGEGQWVHTSLLEAQIFMLDLQAARWLIGRDVPGQAGNNHPTAAPMGVFETSDGHINVAPTPPMWQRFCNAMGRPELIDDPKFAENRDRVAHRQELNGIFGDIITKHGTAHWVALLNESGVPCGPIHSIDRMFADPQVSHLGIAQAVPSEHYDEMRLVGQPVNLSRTPSKLRTAAPSHGEHTAALLTELGYGDTDIEQFSAQGIT